MNNIEGPDVLDTLHNLPNNNSGLFLSNFTTRFKQDAEIVAVCILLHHIDV